MIRELYDKMESKRGYCTLAIETSKDGQMFAIPHNKNGCHNKLHLCALLVLIFCALFSLFSLYRKASLQETRIERLEEAIQILKERCGKRLDSGRVSTSKEQEIKTGVVNPQRNEDPNNLGVDKSLTSRETDSLSNTPIYNDLSKPFSADIIEGVYAENDEPKGLPREKRRAEENQQHSRRHERHQALHLVMDLSANARLETHGSTNCHKYKEWSNENKQQTHGPVSHNQTTGHIIVHKTAHYFVYGQIYYNNVGPRNSFQIRHQRPPHDPRFRSGCSCSTCSCETCNDDVIAVCVATVSLETLVRQTNGTYPDFTTCYTAASVYLEEGSQIYLEDQYGAKILGKPGANFFGIFKV